MLQFPDPLALPSAVIYSRINRYLELTKAAKVGISFRLFVIVFEFIGVALFASTALFLDAVASLIDVISSVFLLFCMRLATRPPDEDHPFGHGRYEPLGGLLLGIMLTVVGGVMLIKQGFDISQLETYQHSFHPLAWIFPAISMAVLEIAYRLVIQVARKEGSPALAADAIHYRIDSLSSLFAMMAIIAAIYFPKWGGILDQLGGIAIDLLMIILGITAARANFHQLMDKVPEPELFDRVRNAALDTPGVEETEKIRIQQYGPDAHVDIDIEVNPYLSVDEAHQISQHTRRAIQKAWPSVRDVTVHIEPFYANDH